MTFGIRTSVFLCKNYENPLWPKAEKNINGSRLLAKKKQLGNLMREKTLQVFELKC